MRSYDMKEFINIVLNYVDPITCFSFNRDILSNDLIFIHITRLISLSLLFSNADIIQISMNSVFVYAFHHHWTQCLVFISSTLITGCISQFAPVLSQKSVDLMRWIWLLDALSWLFVSDNMKIALNVDWCSNVFNHRLRFIKITYNLRFSFVFFVCDCWFG